MQNMGSLVLRHAQDYAMRFLPAVFGLRVKHFNCDSAANDNANDDVNDVAMKRSDSFLSNDLLLHAPYSLLLRLFYIF